MLVINMSLKKRHVPDWRKWNHKRKRRMSKECLYFIGEGYKEMQRIDTVRGNEDKQETEWVFR